MKRILAILLAVCALLFTGCNSHRTSAVEITCTDVITAYENAGYHTFHKEEQSAEDVGYNCYIEITHPDLDGEMYIHFFDTHEDAVAYLDEAPYASIGIGLFSLIWGQPTWVRFKTFNQVSLEYDNRNFYKPFQKLLREKRG